MEIQETERHTEDMQEIITKVPSWILRWGIMLFFGILLMVAAISVFVRYPDTIKSSLKFESSGITMPVVSAVPGIVANLWVKQGAIVKKGQALATIEMNSPNTKYTLAAPQDGKLGFVAIVQHGAFLKANQIVFAIHPVREQFFGIMEMPSSQINKIKIGQQVLISLRNYPADEYGELKGSVDYIADEPTNNGLFIIKVNLNNAGSKYPVILKSWTMGDAEIITQNVSLQSRIFKSVFKGL
ncbi:MAG: hypothetical protein JWP94_97 [Mucilaginibacter sp.]|nr:hypothetical protein [Mucilaginibacter sp.]